jgi:hypothetical protein
MQNKGSNGRRGIRKSSRGDEVDQNAFCTWGSGCDPSGRAPA